MKKRFRNIALPIKIFFSNTLKHMQAPLFLFPKMPMCKIERALFLAHNFTCSSFFLLLLPRYWRQKGKKKSKAKVWKVNSSFCECWWNWRKAGNSVARIENFDFLFRQKKLSSWKPTFQQLADEGQHIGEEGLNAVADLVEQHLHHEQSAVTNLKKYCPFVILNWNSREV